VELKLAAHVLGKSRKRVDFQICAVRLIEKRSPRARSRSTSNGTKNGSRNSRRRRHREMLGLKLLFVNERACAIFLQREHARTDQVREARALFRVEKRVDFSERLRHRLPQIFRALHAVFSGSLGFALVEGFFGDCVGETGDGAAIIDLRLRALRLQLVQDRGELGHLLIAEIELVRQKPQRPANAEPATSAVITSETTAESTRGPGLERISATERSAFVWAVMMSVSTAMTSALAVARLVAAMSFVMRWMRFARVFPPNICRMHVFCFSNSPGLFRSPAGFVCALWLRSQ
jgi:hypothetical protein